MAKTEIESTEVNNSDLVVQPRSLEEVQKRVADLEIRLELNEVWIDGKMPPDIKIEYDLIKARLETLRWAFNLER